MSPLVRSGYNFRIASITILIAVFFALLLAELLFRLMPADRQPYVWLPEQVYEFRPSSHIMPGIAGISRFTINSRGMRGSLFRQDAINIVCIGGSTTECLYLDDRETWTYLLQQGLRTRTHEAINVASIGKSGRVSAEHLREMAALVSQMPSVNTVMVMCGLNDLQRYLSSGKPAMPAAQIFQYRSWEVATGSISAVAFYAKNFLKQFRDDTRLLMQDRNGSVYNRWRQHRSQASCLIDTLPDLEPALSFFEIQLDSMARLANQHGWKLVFVTQAALWRDSLSAYEDSLLWMGGTDDFQNNSGMAYYTPRVLRQGLSAFNDRLRQFCEKQKLLCIDLDRSLPSDTSVFYDDCHFNENGARKVAAVMTPALVQLLQQ